MSLYQQENANKQAAAIYGSSRLSDPTTQIRVLTLQPSTDVNSLLIGDVHHTPGVTHFNALSYVWGDENLREEIVLNGTSTTITKNLADALRRLRAENKATNLWADAICINQCDDEEKAIQVGIMGEIFSRASLTYIWLGEERDHSDLAMEFLANVTEDGMGELIGGSDVWNGLYSLLRRDWWTRVWVIQEAVFSRQPIFKCGAEEVTLNNFADFKENYNTFKYTQHASVLGRDVPFQMFMDRDVRRWASQATINIDLWMMCVTGFKCKYMRDRVYGIRSLFGPTRKQNIDVSYNKHPDTGEFVKSDRTVIIEATVVAFKDRGLLTPLNIAHEKTVIGLNLPSWCSDWSTNCTVIPINFNKIGAFPIRHFTGRNCVPGPWNLRDNEYTSAYPRAAVRNAYWQSRSELALDYIVSDPSVEVDERNYDPFVFSKDHEVLGVRGYIIGTVDFAGVTPFVQVGDTIAEQKHNSKVRAGKNRAAVQEWKAHIETNKTKSYDTMEGGYEEAFWRTLIADRDFDREDGEKIANPGIPGKEWKESFDAWISPTCPPYPYDETVKLYAYPAVSACFKRGFVTTDTGFFGLATALPGEEGVRIGDMVCILRGAMMPCILREIPGTNTCCFEGFAYVHGIMEGEYLEGVKVEDLLEFWIA